MHHIIDFFAAMFVLVIIECSMFYWRYGKVMRDVLALYFGIQLIYSSKLSSMLHCNIFPYTLMLSLIFS